MSHEPNLPAAVVIRELRQEDLEQVVEQMLALLEHVRDASEDPYFQWPPSDLTSSEAAEVLADAKDEFRQRFASLDEDENRKVFVAEITTTEMTTTEITTTAITSSENRLIGYLEAAVFPCFFSLSPEEYVGYIIAAYVNPAQRGQGIGRLLEEAAVKDFQDRGVSYVELSVLSANEGAREMWSALGYRTYREHMRRTI